jgi:hypothetical protein
MKERKKRRQQNRAIVTIVNNSDYYNSETKQILEGINNEYFKAQAGLKKDFILKAAKRLEEIGLPKRTICAELVQHIRFASERMIRKTLTPEYTRDYNGTGVDITHDKVIEDG